MIKCKICNKEFKQITTTHLRSHGVTMDEYKGRYGADSLVSDEIRKLKSEQTRGSNNPRYGKVLSSETLNKISEAKMGKTAHNKGVPMSDDQKSKLSKLAKERYADGFISPATGRKKTDAERKRISEGVKSYALQNPEELSARGKKSTQTRKKNGNPLWSYQTSEERSLIGKRNIRHAQKARSRMKLETRDNNLEKANITLLGVDDRTVTIQCNECNKVAVRDVQFLDACRLFKSDECSLCVKQNESLAEKEIRSLFSSDIITNSRSLISPHEVDIYDPVSNIAIEYCGLYWHSELRGKNKTYHVNKYNLLKQQGIGLITIFEDEYVDHSELVKSMIRARMGQYDHIYNARELEITTISSPVLNSFLNDNHIQGSGRSQYKVGLYKDDQLLSVMSFMKGETSRKNRNTWEINRYATKAGVRIRGGASRLFKKFLNDIDPETVISYADLRWGEGRVYEAIGFTRCDNTVPNYWYIKNNAYPLKRWHRYGMRKNENDDPNLTEWENRVNQGWDRIWDCGSAKYVWE